MNAINTWQHEQLMELVDKSASLAGTEKQKYLQRDVEQLQRLYDRYHKNLLTLRDQIKEYEKGRRKVKAGMRSSSLRRKNDYHEKV